ncbi:hypothetical protein BZG01_03860 [Labilibaculum manganireducens]|uniref:Lipoprotein n=1 Tax=Labilibaculum manganireducens TaxID=1940525 RepID=A0A2N3IDN7_9BACT|nr:hypothetical protein [Labilibaculum manganireducens]PKQ68363.1 hypothetical protein BZG01_03860 [Labilibaculum manganireducens]
MKKLIFTAFVVLSVLVSCNQSNKKQEAKQVGSKEFAPQTIAQVMKTAEQNVGKEVFFTGMVQHVCAHSGRRAILLDETGKLSLRVEATGKINGFNRELSGATIAVKGTLQEKRLYEKFINDWEAKVKAKEDAEEGGEHCASEMTNINQMREWMKKANRNFYSVYFVDGTSYEIVE